MLTFTPEQRRRFAADIDGDYRPKTKKAIVLVGLMGSGKTALGKRLAVALGLPFVDSDTIIEEKSGLLIRYIFEISGEAKFRDIEHKTILSLLNSSPVILSTGGGAFCNPETRTAIKTHAISLWLDAKPTDLLHRIGNTSSRPLLNKGDPLQTLSHLRQQRKADYQQAELHVSTGRHSLRLSMKKILNILEQNSYIEALSKKMTNSLPAYKA